MMSDWDRSKAIVFGVSVCLFYWTLTIAGSFGPQLRFAIPGLQLVIGSKFVLLMAAPLLPAIFCVAIYPECRASLTNPKASWVIYLAAVVVGPVVPFASYFGSHYSDFPWGNPTAVTFIRVFALNLFLSPLWEEIIWRGCFLKKIEPLCTVSGGILLSALGWTVWHGGFIAYLHSEGIPVNVLLTLPLIYFSSGIIFGALFQMGRGSLWPSVVLHAGFNAATLVYYRSHDRVSELSSYVAEMIFICIVAAIFFVTAVRRGRSSQVAESSRTVVS